MGGLGGTGGTGGPGGTGGTDGPGDDEAIQEQLQNDDIPIIDSTLSSIITMVLK